MVKPKLAKRNKQYSLIQLPLTTAGPGRIIMTPWTNNGPVGTGDLASNAINAFYNAVVNITNLPMNAPNNMLFHSVKEFTKCLFMFYTAMATLENTYGDLNKVPKEVEDKIKPSIDRLETLGNIEKAPQNLIENRSDVENVKALLDFTNSLHVSNPVGLPNFFEFERVKTAQERVDLILNRFKTSLLALEQLIITSGITPEVETAFDDMFLLKNQIKRIGKESAEHKALIEQKEVEGLFTRLKMLGANNKLRSIHDFGARVLRQAPRRKTYRRRAPTYRR